MKSLCGAAAIAALVLAVPKSGAAAQSAVAPPAAVAPAPASTAAAPIPIRDLAVVPAITGPLLSPDGTRILAKINIAGLERLGIFRIDGAPGQPPQIVDGSPQMTWYRWAGNDRLLIGATATGNVVGIQFPLSRLVAYDLRTNRAQLLVVPGGGGFLGDDVIYTDPAGAYILLSAQADMLETPNVYRVDLATGRMQMVQRKQENVWNWFADGNGVVRAGVEYGEGRMRLHYRAAADQPLRRLEARRIDRDSSVIESVRFLNDTSRGLVVTNADTGRFAIYDYNFETDARGAALFEHPEVDVTAPIIGADGRVAGVSYEDDRPRIHWIDPALAQLQQSIDRALPGKTNIMVDHSLDGNRVLLWSGAADDPGTYYVYDRAARRMDGFAQPHEQLDSSRLAPVRPVRYRSRDGLQIPGYLTLPRGRDPRGLPLIVMPHGGPFMRDSWTFNAEVQFLASRGYAVFQPNFRGSTGYGREFVERGFGQLGGGMIDDMEDGVDWLAGEGTIDPRRVCIMGGSYGGYAAMWSSVRSAPRYRCAISFAGVSDLRALLRHDARSVIPRRYIREWRRRIRGEESSDLDSISPLKQVARVAVPLLIAHGEKDERVPVAQSRDLVRALERRGAPVESVFYPNAGHGFTLDADQEDYLRRVEAFLARHNPAS